MPGFNMVASCGDDWEMECERYFYDGMDSEEDHFKSTAPSEDIWKKFELLPTPPMSPSRTLDGDTVFPLSLDWLGYAPSRVPSLDEDYEGCKVDPLDIFGNLSSIVIKDCMWSGLSASQRLEKVVQSERQPVAHHVRLPVGPHAGVNSTKSQRCAPGTPHADTPATECVDPTAVLNLPLPQPKRPATVSTGSDSRSDSSDEDNCDDDDDEIDVVTVDNLPKRGRPARQRTPVTILVHADPHGPCPKRFHVSLHRQQHNYAAPSPDTEPDDDDEDGEDDDEAESGPPGKRSRLDTPSSSPSSPFPSSASSPGSSDSEDPGERRRNHNFLERKRRNDLRSRFLALRQQLPGLAGSAKAPKVAILTRATEYLLQLHARQRRQTQERKKLRARQQQLLRKLSSLKGS